MGILLSIDGSTTATGLSIFDTETKELLKYGVYKCDSKTEPDRRNRIWYMLNGVKEFIDTYHPTQIVMEEVPPAVGNSDTVLALGVLQGGVLCLAKQYGIPAEWISVSTWHSALKFFNGTQEGKSTDNMKQCSVEFANRTYGTQFIYKSKSSKFNQDNESDSVCIGHYYLHRDEYVAEKKKKKEKVAISRKGR